MFQPFRLGELELNNRVVVSPMDMYSAVDGVPGDFHLVHLGSKALGGAGLVMTEMVCVSEAGPDHAGLHRPLQRRSSAEPLAADRGLRPRPLAAAKIGIQLGHSGRKGSTRLMWEGIDEPLPEGNWEVSAPRRCPTARAARCRAGSTARAGRDPGRVRRRGASRRRRPASTCSSCTARTATCCPPSSRPLTNQRTDEYGGSLANRLRYPLEVFDAVRAVWPRTSPMTVRISATDWCEGGGTRDDAVEIARAFVEHGAAGIDVSTGPGGQARSSRPSAAATRRRSRTGSGSEVGRTRTAWR